ncbi:MAG: hypothetical protein KF901_20580 [Myxococcales bacterium]|nr:hypothetical protein [Myxococcales bacterium]
MTRLVLLVALAGCAPHLYSPPGRSLPLEGAATVAPGETALQLEGGVSGAVFGPTVAHGTARVRHGVAEDIEVVVEGNAVLFENGWSTDAHRGVYGARVGAKLGFSPHFAFTFGAGAGGSAAGGFVSPDLGLIGSYDNPYVVPFLSLRGFFSQPFAVRSVAVNHADRTELLTPDLTWGFAWSTGVRIPVGAYDEDFGRRRAALVVGVGSTSLFDREPRSEHFFGGSVGFELML